MRLGVLSWEWGKIVRLTTESRVWTNLGVEEQLLIFSSCLSPGQKASKLRRLASASKLATVLIWNNQSHHEDGGPVTPVKVYKISTLWNANDLRQLSFWHRALSCERCLHLNNTFAYLGAHNNLLLMLRAIHKLKTARIGRFLWNNPWTSTLLHFVHISALLLSLKKVAFSLKNSLTTCGLMSSYLVTIETDHH